MKKQTLVIIACLLLACQSGFAQRITYSDPDKDDARTLNFEILGKMNGKVLVYKNYRDLHYVAAYDNDMKMVDKNKLDFITSRVLSTDFIMYTDFVYMIYQYQKKASVYCMLVKIDGSGKKMGEPVMLDSTDNINYSSNSKIYSVINSEDKQKIMVFKINTKNDKAHLLTTLL